MSNYNQLMALINKTAQSTEQQDDGKGLVTKTLEVLDTVTSEAYVRTVDAVGSVVGAAQTNVMATPKAFSNGYTRGQERAAAVLIKLLSK